MKCSALLCAAGAFGLMACPAPVPGPNGGGVKVVAPSLPGPPVAKIGDRTLSVGDLQARLDTQSPFARARYRDPEKMKQFVESQLKFEVLAEEAMARGYHQDPEALDAVKKIIVQKLSREEYDGAVKMNDVTDDEMRTYYEANKEEYNKPEMIRASLVLIPFGTDKVAAKATADLVYAEASDPARIDDRNHFKALVAKHSKHEESRKLGGDLRYLGNDEVKDKFGPAALAALTAAEAVNAVTPVVDGPDAFYIFKRTGRRKPIVRDFDSVRSQIRNKLYRDKKSDRFNAWIDELKAVYKVEVFDKNIEKLNAGSGDIPAPRDPHSASPDLDDRADPHGGMDVHDEPEE